MIIGITGKIGAGKDTVGKIIQYLTATKEYQKANSFGQFLYDCNGHGFVESTHKWKVKKYAAKLKEIASIITSISIEKFEDQEFKKTFLGNEWNKEGEIADITTGLRFSEQINVRNLLQKIGTECFRDNLHENTWVNALFADYKEKIVHYPLTKEQEEYNNKQTRPVPSVNEKLDFPNWLITDLRFPNEYQAIKEKDGICVRVHRKNINTISPIGTPIEVDRNISGLHTNHLSEIALDNHTFDWEINNNSSIEDLVEKVRKMLINFEIIK